MKILILILAILFILYLLALRGRTGHPGLEELKKWKYAHRGLHSVGVPENSMAAFRAALEGGFGIELDVHLMKDGRLAVIHDACLKRTAGANVQIEDLTAQDLSQYHLEGTYEQIPLFDDVLALYQGKAPLIVELKSVGSNAGALCEAACALLDTYDGAYCLESFDPRCVLWLRKHRPELLRGQLSENFFKSSGDLSWILRLVMTILLPNFLVLPDFVAYRFSDRKLFSNVLCRKLWGIQGVTWTVKSQQELDAAVAEGYIPIFEGFVPQ